VARPSVFDQLNVTRVINASGIYTDLGGSILSPTVQAAVTEINGSFVDMVELLDRSGERIAERLGMESARVTPGASAAIALGVAACVSGGDQTKMARLPETEGMPNQVILQRGHRYKYARCALLAGARILEIGEPDETRPEEIERAIGPQTAALFVPAHLDGHNGTVPLTRVAAIGQRTGVPTLVDAAYMNDPVTVMGSFAAAGADLVCFSAKYFGGPNAGGFIAGRADLVATVAGLDFTRHESGPYRRFGRAFKMDRSTVVATVLALEEWLAMDHRARWAGYLAQVERLRAALDDLPDTTLTPMCFTLDERLVPEPVNALVVDLSPERGQTAQELADHLANGDPSIRCVVENGSLVVVVETLKPGDDVVIVDRLRHAIAA
jgi:D-glucosaminate-6-phosphate ammonia-lyase